MQVVQGRWLLPVLVVLLLEQFLDIQQLRLGQHTDITLLMLVFHETKSHISHTTAMLHDLSLMGCCCIRCVRILCVLHVTPTRTSQMTSGNQSLLILDSDDTLVTIEHTRSVALIFAD